MPSPAARILPWLAVLIGICLTVLAFYPGYMSLDSFEQLKQARSGIYHLAHPPLMAWIWSFFDRVIPGPLGMLIFFAAMFWIGLALFINARIANPVAAAGMILAVGLFPSVFALLGTVWKDVGMGAALVLAAGLVSRASKSGNKYVLAASLPFLFFAFSVRHEAGFAVFPLLLWIGIVWKRRFLISLLAALTCLAVFGGLKALIHRSLTNAKSIPSSVQIVWIFDLVGLSLHSGPQLLPPYLTSQNPDFNFEDVKRIYDPTSSLPLFKDSGTYRRFPMAKTREEFESLAEYWLRAVRENPRQYLENRWLFFRGSLAIGKRIVCFPYQVGISANALGMTHLDSRLNRFVRANLTKIRNTWIFRAWVYLAVCLIFFCVGVWLRSLEICLLSASALLYEAIHFFILPACDFRYHWWTVLSVFLCLVVLIAELNSSPGPSGSTGSNGAVTNSP